MSQLMHYANDATEANVGLALDTQAAEAGRLNRLKDYEAGRHDLPYTPETAGDEYKLLAERSVTNITRLVVDATAQALFVDDFQTGSEDENSDSPSPFWQHWLDSNMTQRQQPIWRAALTYGAAFALTEKDERDGKIRSKGLSPLRTIPLFVDSTAIQPDAALHIVRFPKGEELGEARYWDWDNEYRVYFKDGRDFTWEFVRTHGAKRCPVTRVSPYVDLDGNATGVVEPLIPIQNRLNQTVFDLLIGQSYTAHVVRWATGIAPPYRMTRDSDGRQVPQLDDQGNPIVDPVRGGASHFLFAEKADAKFGTLEGGDLTGLISAVEGTLQVIASVGQVPPNFLLGKIANVNAEALNAASMALSRKNAEIANVFAASVDRMMRVYGEIAGIEMPDGQVGTVMWRDLSISSLAQHADALGKFAQLLSIPPEALWERVPGATRSEIAKWRAAKEDADAMQMFSNDFQESTISTLPDYREQTSAFDSNES